MELTREGIEAGVAEAERLFGAQMGTAPLRLGLYWAQECRRTGTPSPEDADIRKAAELFCQAFPPEPPSSERDVRYWMRIGLNKRARTESVAVGLPRLPSPEEL